MHPFKIPFQTDAPSSYFSSLFLWSQEILLFRCCRVIDRLIGHSQSCLYALCTGPTEYPVFVLFFSTLIQAEPDAMSILLLLLLVLLLIYVEYLIVKSGMKTFIFLIHNSKFYVLLLVHCYKRFIFSLRSSSRKL